MPAIDKIASRLTLRDGVWVATERSGISYPDEGNDACYQIEDSSFWFHHRNNCIVAAMRRFPPSGPVFDIGGGNGFVSKAIETAGFDPVLVEPGETGIVNAKTRGLGTIVHATLQDAGFRPSSLAAAGLFDVVEHIEDDLGFMEELRTCLRPGGRVYLTVPAYDFLFSDEDVEAGHFRRYTKRTLSNCLAKAGLDIEFASYFFVALPAPIWLFRTLPAKLSRSRPKKEALVSASEHVVPSPLLGKMVDAAFSWEARLIAKAVSLPFGGSCLFVARNPG